MDEQLTQRVVDDLSKHRSRNEIIRMICEQGGVNWPEAEQQVKQIEAQHAHTITRRQTPLLMFLSIGTLLIGAAMLAYSAEFFIAFFQGQPLEMILSLRSGYYRVIGAFTGLGMVVGGLIGLWKTIVPLLGDWATNVALLIGGSSPLATGTIGLAMMAGGAIGMWMALDRYFQT